MPIGANGEKCPNDPAANGVLIGKIATRLAAETTVDVDLGEERTAAANQGPCGYAQRSEVVRKAVDARWGR